MRLTPRSVRIALAGFVVATFGPLAFLGIAAEPASGTLTDTSEPVTYTAGPFVGSHADAGCNPLAPCDYFALTVNVSAGYLAAHPNALVTVDLTWEPQQADLDMSVYNSAEEDISGEGGGNLPGLPEHIEFPAANGEYTVEIRPYAGTGATATAVIALDPNDDAGGGGGLATGQPPRYQIYAPDYPKHGFGMFGGEATMAVNWSTNSIFYLGFLETLRLKLDDSTSPALETWEKMPTNASSKATSDPIMVGDIQTDRIFAMQLLFPEGQSAMDYSDDDGLTWIPAMAGGFGSGADHQAMDVGPYPPGTGIQHPLYENAIYYCSQDVALAFCSRSDDGGLTFGPVVPIYTQGQCNGLHGHVKVATDGTVYVPNSKCAELGSNVGILADNPAVIVSEDAGATWTVKLLGADIHAGGGSDPSLASATDGTVYMAWTDTNLRLHMAKSADHGDTWLNDINIGEAAGITAAEFPAVVAGDPDRAAVAFFGTTHPTGTPEDGEGFAGTWDLYVATTYDGGQTYHVVNVTEGDPIQRGPICGGNYCRNLLDFFDAVIDPQGRVLVSYEDGCVGTCVQGGVSQFTDQAVIARQSGGRTLFAANDGPLLTKPGAPRVEGYRLPNFTYLEWPAVDNGGSPVTEYRVYRGTVAGGEVLLKSVGNKRQFADTAAIDPDVTYYYRVSAVNAVGESALGNALALPVDDVNAPTPHLACVLPGWKTATDLTGEAEASPSTRDISEIYVAEPESMPGKLVVTLRAATPAPNQNGANFQVYFGIEGVNDKTWRASINSGAETLEYWDGEVEPTDDTLDWQRVYKTFNEGLDAGASGFVADESVPDESIPAGFVRFVLNKEALGLANGSRLLAVTGWSYPSSASSSNVTREESGYFDYKVVGNDFCEKGGITLPPIGPGAGPIINGNNRLGGAMPLSGLLVFVAVAAIRRRRSP